MSFLSYSAYISAIICVGGILFRLLRWFALPAGPESGRSGMAGRLLAALTAVGMTVLSPRRMLAVLNVLLQEVLLQLHLLRRSRRRWAMHMMLFYGIVLLLLMHTFDGQITSRWFSDYASTRNPFMFLRNALGLLVLAGVIAAVWRRRSGPVLRRTAARADRWMLVLLTGIVLSGALLEAVQIVSPVLFDQMVVDYMGSDDPEEIAPLKAFWAAHYDVAFTPQPLPAAADVLAEGRRQHEAYCAGCHSRPRSAVLAYPLALALKPLFESIMGLDLDLRLWVVHYLISCLALALLPFSKLMHLFTTPVSLIVRAQGATSTDDPVNRPTRRIMAMDACTHCGVCSQHCAVAPVWQVVPNPRILPSEKLRGVARMAAGRNRGAARALLAEGSFICTDCGRCTRWCPSGIDLQDMWAASKADLIRQGYPDPHAWIGRHTAVHWAEVLKTQADTAADQTPLRRPPVRLADNPGTFWACVQCSTCTNVCPVVAVSEDPRRDLEMTPQQVMNLMRLQLTEQAIGSRMVWNCVTCYKCQEHCPQGVRVADVIYELRNEACRRLMPTPPPAGGINGKRR